MLKYMFLSEIEVIANRLLPNLEEAEAVRYHEINIRGCSGQSML